MSKGKKKYEQLDNDTVNVKVLRGQGNSVYLYMNDVMVAGPVELQSNLLSDTLLCSFNTKIIDLPRIK